ncbi:integral membrane sensor signal transduction histidine kinase [Ferrimonas balearica DSM 9799]|uniref:histidine kinase n=1 Tax=Ferrimonas balearica (strain DSM 9799 / CCM 4581 / KCTC 23876 / PAT) TaxID=550540 RepID=E1STD0_FERBD|nr:ATP-binding protein [Ferrimonas balearica]ADN77164.1 integral membrane sensor signal transduction histidine kinase [Ferrimonas balearica DSM 9799]
MIPGFIRFYLLLVLLVVGAALMLDGMAIWDQHNSKFWLNSDDLKRAIANQTECLTQQTSCPLFELHPLAGDSIQLSPELANELAHGQPLLVQRNDQQGWLYLQEQGQLYKLGPIPLSADQHQEWDGQAIWFYGSVSLLFLLWVLPLFHTLHRLNRAAMAVSNGSQPRALKVQRHSVVAPLVNSFNQMTRSLTELMQLQRELSATVCHEIRTPLARLRFASEMVEQTPAPILRQRLQGITDEIDLLLDEYLVYAACEQRRPQLDSVTQPLYPLLAKVQCQYQPLLSQQIRLDCPTDLHACFDSTTLSRAVNNLVSNAAKFAHQQIDIRVERRDGEIQLVVADDGPGILSQDNLMEPFVRADQRNKGYGLGLAIVRRVMEWHKGRVHIGNCSKLGGAAVELHWPTKNAANAPGRRGFS